MKDSLQVVKEFIDPGIKGGVATVFGSLNKIKLSNFDTPTEYIEHLLELEGIHKGFLQVYIEAAPAYCGKNIPSSSAFKLGKSCGLLEGIVRARQIPLEFISPKKWQAPLAGLKGLTGNPRKKALKDHACRLFPHLKPTLRTADALLMAHFHSNIN